MSELILGHYTKCLVLFWHLLIPTCPSCIVWRIFSLSDGGMMRTSPQRMRPSSTVRMCTWLMVMSRGISGALRGA